MKNPARDTKLTQTRTLPSRGVYSSRVLDRWNNHNTTEKMFSVWSRCGYNPLNMG